ncbi:MAG: hypothetical protein U1A77_11715 [Pirellulales bacterium]|jgi:hypothetical protein
MATASTTSAERPTRDYEELRKVARHWIDHVAEEIAQRDPRLGDDREGERLVDLFRKRRFGEFRRRISVKSPLEHALLEYFLLSRIRSYVLAYLSVQEGEEFEGATEKETQAPLLIAQMLRNTGRRSSCGVRLGWGRWRVFFNLDPLVDLRKLYALEVLGRRKNSEHWQDKLARLWHVAGFHARSKFVELLGRRMMRRASGTGRNASSSGLIERPDFRRLAAICLLMLFPETKKLKQDEWLRLLRRLEEFFVPRIAHLWRAMPPESVANHGFVKLFKVAFGTVVGRVAVRAEHEADTEEFIFNTLRLAYSWGITYPLVDNVLDSESTTAQVRDELMQVLVAVFAGGEPDKVSSDSLVVQEVGQRLAEVMSLIPKRRLPYARQALANLLESHRRDSHRRLADVPTNADDRAAFEQVVLEDTALKAALVRLATMEICGIEVDDATLDRGLSRSLFNQLGDDLWDIYEDVDDNRVTPFTLFLKSGGTLNPFDYYLQYAVVMTRNMTRRRRSAAFMGCCETLRDFLLTKETRSSDPLQVSGQIADTLNRQGVESLRAVLEDVPHVDFDAVLFAFEDALFSLSRK